MLHKVAHRGEIIILSKEPKNDIGSLVVQAVVNHFESNIQNTVFIKSWRTAYHTFLFQSPFLKFLERFTFSNIHMFFKMVLIILR